MKAARKKPLSRIQKQNRATILEAALNVFSTHGFRGATLDQIAQDAGLSKPNILYYFDGKEAIHIALLSQLLDAWLDPLRRLNAEGEPREELMRYIRRKLQMSREFPRESRLFANEIVQGAPRIEGFLSGELRALVDEKATVLQTWMDAGKIEPLDPYHLLFSIWAMTQHYADFEAQILMIRSGQIKDSHEGSDTFVETIFTKILLPET
ncbi:MAG: TetR family transcriptional regulator C-terminal domain-containing protein [Paracoccaceae bacterium]|jgi:TetR/AcrR family transcriptional regulator|nr:TetR family transcriptional regulator [Paracoccaceae bacterium]NCW52513.1 TetR family transcriptional regulator [Paracoccaceae bacterium]NDD09049.1 TetR family transcriptional regulator [Paracoccaceae bacterium]NDH25580.1 TetR family transcriptional regulator [Paracoccaceae bacterium]|tara:strand:- start:1414 stop:2040 length:627 start_codon:yes stop_codon:yes gene_type:complete